MYLELSNVITYVQEGYLRAAAINSVGFTELFVIMLTAVTLDFVIILLLYSQYPDLTTWTLTI